MKNTKMNLENTDDGRRRVSVLFVEDDPLARLTGRRCLESLQYHVADVGSCAEAEQAWRANEFDLVVSDYRLPDGLCVEMLGVMRAAGYATPVICVTAESECVPEDTRVRLNIVGVVSKPMDMELLRSAVVSATGAMPWAGADRAGAGRGTGLERVGRFAVADCSGLVDADSIRALAAKWNGEAWLALDMAGTTRLAQDAVPALVTAAERRRSDGGRLCVVGISGDALVALKVARADRDVDVVRDMAALASLGRRLSSVCERACLMDSVVTGKVS